MPYDSKLDQKLFSKNFDSEQGTIVVGVFSYNGGIKKLQLTRESQDENGQTRFAKLGRLTRVEVEGILPLIQEALEKMKD